MTNIELIIRMSEEDYKKVLEINNRDCEWNNMHHCYEAVLNGIPLPKEYGDLVDRDAINNKFNAICDELEALSNQTTYKELLNKLSMCLDTAEPIIKNNYEKIEEELWT